MWPSQTSRIERHRSTIARDELFTLNPPTEMRRLCSTLNETPVRDG